MRLKINAKSIFIYSVYAVAAMFANCAVGGVPLSLGLCFAMLVCGTNIIATPILFVLASIVNLDLIFSVLCLASGIFLGLIVFLYRRSGRKIKLEACVYLLIALALYVTFGTVPDGEFFITNPYALRAVAAAVTLIFTFFCTRTVYAILYRLERCRLREDELVCLAIVYAVCGTGIAHLFGVPAYIFLSAFIIVFAVRLCRSPSSLVFGLVCALPAAAAQFSLMPLTAFIIITTAALLFSGAGRFATGTICAALFALYAYFSGFFDCEIPIIVVYALILFFACFIPSLKSSEKYENLRRRLLVLDVLTETAVVRARRATSEKLYRISEVFREIECAFFSLDENVDEQAVRSRMFVELKEKCCNNCERCKRCERTNVYTGFSRLIDAGCIKGKVNLIDLPSEMTVNCARPADVLNELNLLLTEYRRCMTENENAKSGRKMLAEQARGVSEVMKSCAVDLSRMQSYTGAAEGIKHALSAHGISCPEVYVDSEGTNEVCAVTVGNVDIKLMCAVIGDVLKKKYALKDKIIYDGQKTCLIFSAPPKFDAAFGVAYAIKSGERVSGDTHSVIRINEHCFLMALSDGMGSGEYARKVSESAISLIEAFYRAEMPEDTILKTINSLLSFNRDERFTCIDISAVNLETGRADFVKIGSPAGIILREGEIRILESTSLPLGILDNLRPTVSCETLKSGDLVVFMSDGITSAFPSQTDLYEFLQELKPLNPQNLADTILAAALDKTGHKACDDMTVLCTRIFEN